MGRLGGLSRPLESLGWAWEGRLCTASGCRKKMKGHTFSCHTNAAVSTCLRPVRTVVVRSQGRERGTKRDFTRIRNTKVWLCTLPSQELAQTGSKTGAKLARIGLRNGGAPHTRSIFSFQDLMTFVRGTAELAFPCATREHKVGPTNCENLGALSPRSTELTKIVM